jgi:predicted MPP superfamily phosphohydrolase
MDTLIRKESLNLWGGEEDLKIFHISDIHLKWNIKKLKLIHQLILRHRPELILFTGDYFDTPTGLRKFIHFIRKISAQFKCVFISGNHEHWFWAKKRFANSLKKIPNTTDLDSVDFNYTSQKGFHYLITSRFQRTDSSPARGKKTILLIHNPENIVESSIKGIDLILAGHLHGGQFIFKRLSNHSYFPGNLIYKYCIDKTKIGNTTLIVSKGAGDTFPFRYKCPKEIIMIEIE